MQPNNQSTDHRPTQPTNRLTNRPTNQTNNHLSFLPGSMDAPTTEDTATSAVVVTKLNFSYDGMDRPALKDFDLCLLYTSPSPRD